MQPSDIVRRMVFACGASLVGLLIVATASFIGRGGDSDKVVNDLMIYLVFIAGCVTLCIISLPFLFIIHIIKDIREAYRAREAMVQDADALLDRARDAN